MKRIWASIAGWLAAGFAALCCFGIPLAISGLALLGLPFLTTDLFLIPLMLVSLGIYIWGIRKSGHHDSRWPMILALTGSAFAFAGIWLSSYVSAIGFLLMLAGFILTIIANKR